MPGAGPPTPYPVVTAVAEVTAAAAAAAANLSGPPVTAVWVAIATTMTRERAGVSEAAAVDCGTMAALLSARPAAVASGTSTAVVDAGDRLATLTAVASAIDAHAAVNTWVPVEMVARGGCPHSPPCSWPCPCRRPPTARRRARRRSRRRRRRCSLRQ